MTNEEKKKETFRKIKKFFKDNNCELITTEYIGNKQKLEYRCSNGHIQTAIWGDLRQKKRPICIICNKDNRKYRRLSDEYVNKVFSDKGYTVLSKYKNTTSKLEVSCPEGHIFETTYSRFRSGHGCPVCSLKRRVNSRKIPFSIVKKLFEDNGYKLITTDYKNCDQKLSVVCPNNHVWAVSYKAFKKGARCRYCFNKIRNKHRRLGIDVARDIFEKEGYKLLSTKYINVETKLEYICPKGHKSSMSLHNFKSGQRCPICNNNNGYRNIKHTLEFVRSQFEKEGYTLLSTEYINCHTHLKSKCSRGHIWNTTYQNFVQGHRCPRCGMNGTSKAEQELADFLKPHFPDLVRNDRLLISPFELDIVIPSKRTAIEYCGLYWHSELNGKNRSYHLQKLTKCESIGYNLITIFEDEWVQKRNIAESRLKNILGIDDAETLYARNCVIKEIDARTKNEFLDRNHLQGRDNSSVKLGAFYKDKLVSVMTFSKGNISKGAKAESGVWELNRFCSDYDYHIVGIASKLLKYFKNNYDYTKIYSYSDRRWSTGKLYETLGFMKSHDSEPNYWYLVGDIRVHRFGFRKGVLKKKLELFDSKLSEWQNMVNNGFNRIWDCGNTKWETFSAF